jgi:Spy/CpxP family protein refolding chaperone
MMQSGQHGPGQGAMPMPGGADAGAWSEPALAPIHDALTFCPSRILGQKDVLELTPQQEVKLEQMLEPAQTAIEAAQAEAQKESDALAAAIRLGKPDIRDVERHFQALHAALGRAHLVRLRTSIQARAVLTDEQREKMIGPFASAGGCGVEHHGPGGH